MKNHFFIVVSFASFFLGILLTWQLRTEVAIEGNFPSDEISAKDELIKELLDDQSYLQSRIVSLRKEIETTQENVSSQAERSKLKKLDEIKQNIGLSELSGPGLKITLDDSPTINRLGEELNEMGLVQASDIRDTVNALNAGGADGIAVNNQRVISSSVISSVGSSVLVNNSPISPPFEIRAIGDRDLMIQRMQDQNLIPEIYEKVRKGGINFQIEAQAFISIPIYNGDLKINYLNLVSE